MKQLSFFDDDATVPAVVESKAPVLVIHNWKLFVDGASRNNPGPSGGGYCIFKDGVMVKQGGYFFGIKTNNQAEYLALLLGLFFIEPLINLGDHVVIVADSELLVRQVNGIYKVKNVLLQRLHLLACQEVKQFGARVMHTLRHDNKDADKMANKGVDDKKFPPKKFLEKLTQYEIAF